MSQLEDETGRRSPAVAPPGGRAAEAESVGPQGTPAGRGATPEPALERAIRRAQRALLRAQEADGSWRYPLEGSSVLPEAHFVLANRLFDFLPPGLEDRLVERIRERQLPNGGWPLYPGHDGHVSASLEAYFALRLHGLPRKADGLRRARRFLAERGGLGAASSLTRVTLAVTGQLEWSEVPLLPIEVLLLPAGSPFSLYSFVSFTRIHLVSILALGELRYRVPGVRVRLDEELAEDGGGASRRASWSAPAIAREAAARIGRSAERARRALSPAALRQRCLRAAHEYLLAHQEPDGTWGNYILSTLFGALAMQALGCRPDSRTLQRAFAGLRSLLWERGADLLVQPCNSAVWSTAVLSYCLAESGVEPGHPALSAASRWLLDRQSFQAGDWRVGCPKGPVGTWGFQDGNAFFPDVDDTIAAVRAILPQSAPGDQFALDACRRGEEWALAMQNDDGGWSSFDRNCRSWWLERIPFNDMVRAMTDPSTADMTGRMLEFLGVRGWRTGRREVDAGVRSLARSQEADGSWFGRWGISYLYGTWAALTGMGAVGVRPDAPQVRRATAWLERVQNEDGGWGESCRADTEGRYVPLGASTPSQTAWGLMGLVSSAREVTPAIRRGLEFLLREQTSEGTWAESYTTGAGFAGKLYLDYRFYKDAWPLQALTLARRLVHDGAAWPR
ncbi:MAG: squalene--hopene cyclase [Planctomycetes bacterium]|nr:squalene--hopene cyclase [Planctomycetota bacterium]